MTHDNRLGELVEQAVNTWISENDGGNGMVGNFFLMVEFIDTDGDEAWVFATPADQKTSTSMGLLKWGMGVTEYEQRAHLDGIARS